MKKLLLTTLLSTAVLTTTFSASAMMGNGNGDCGKNAMNMQNMELTTESITQMFERRLEMRGNKNIKLDSVTEKDGKFVVRITTLDGELVQEKIIDPKNPQRGMMGGMMSGEPLTLEQAKKVIEGRLAMRGNPNIKLGEIKEVDGKFVAKITTQKGSLVEEITIDPQDPRGMMGKGKGMMGKGKGMNPAENSEASEGGHSQHH